ncbi:hypothetical protein [Streptomyces subrutilus]|uniref:hypothetical protein n=1 Tax=Streptomyces subrutilus TaxID=36818 RepID=UPI000B1089D6|nr:hypothetical protein [Streptomyces subrutilus]
MSSSNSAIASAPSSSAPNPTWVEKLTGCGWLGIPGTAGDLLASRPENATQITVPSLAPREDGTGPFTFGKKMRPKLSGWAQKVISDISARPKPPPQPACSP